MSDSARYAAIQDSVYELPPITITQHNGLILQQGDTGPMLYLKYGRSKCTNQEKNDMLFPFSEQCH